MKKIAILTYQYNNYGTKLQNYALKRALEKLGFEAASVSVKFRKDTFRIFVKLLLETSFVFVLVKYRKFNRFSDTYLNRVTVTYNQLNSLNKGFDYFVSGSDQVWNPNHLRTRKLDRGLFFLSFVTNNSKKISYAPSFGVDRLGDEEKIIYGTEINSFCHVSVREISGAKIIMDLTGRDAEVLPDPTLLLNKGDWDEITCDFDEKYATKKYAVAYYLSDQSLVNRQRIEKYAQEKNLEFITISGDVHKKGSIVPDPSEFVALIKYAQVVFTDSFHACVFSMINETPFIVRRRTDVSQFTRIENLLSKYSLESAIDNDDNIADIISRQDFTASIKEIDVQRSKGLEYLKGALKS